MKQLFGMGFVTIHGETPAPLWIAEIHGLTDKQVRGALGKLAKQARKYPANLTEFLEAARGSGSPRYLGQNPFTHEDVERERLSPPKASRETIDKHLRNMRRSTGQLD